MMKKLQIIWVALMFSINGSVLAQDLAVTGRVTDADTRDGLPGATVLVQGTMNGSVTDIDGYFTIQSVSGDAILSISFLGYISIEEALANRSQVNVVLQPDVQALDEIVVMGYTTQKKKDLTGSVSVVDVDEVQGQPNANILQSLQGRAAGVTIVNDGQPGTGRNQVRVRGMTTLNNNAPLYVVDGIPTVEALDNLNPNDIESIQVLKDASSASIYGSRSAGGVIVITTRKGKAGVLSVDGGVVSGVQTPINTIKVLDAQQWGQLYWDATYNTIGLYPELPLYGGQTQNPQIIENVPFTNDDTDQLYEFTRKGTNWADEVYRTAKNNQYYVNVNSGSEKGSVGLGFSYFDQEGIIKGTYYERLIGRVNTSYKITPWIEVGENLNVSWSNQSQTSTQDTQGGIPYQVLRQHPALPVYDTYGGYAGGNTTVGGLAFPNSINPVAELSRQGRNNSESWRVFGNTYLQADVLDPFVGDAHALVLKTNVGLDYSNFFDKNYAPSFQEGGFTRPEAVYTNAYGEGRTLTWINTANYKYTGDKHSLSVLGGMEAVAYDFKDLNAGRSGYLLEDENYVQVGSGADSTATNGGGTVQWGLRSFFGRVDYGLNDKYLFSATLRYDETSRLNTVGYFPAFSVGWNLQNEKFASPLFSTPVFNGLKLRASWGQQGNQSIDNYAIYSTLGTDRARADYDISGNNTSVYPGLIVRSRGNMDVVWETTTQYDLGADFSLFDYKLQVIVDYYSKRTEDILATPAIPSAVGSGTPPVRNTATVDNKGIEISLDFREERSSGLNYGVGLQFSQNMNEVVSLGEGVGSEGYEGEYYMGFDGETRAATGHPFPSFYGWKVEGIFQDQTDVNTHADQGAGSGIGRLKYMDISGPDGGPDGVIDDLDRTYLGDAVPNITLGLNLNVEYKGVSITAFLYSALGHQIYNYTKQNTDFFEPNFNVGTRILNAWSPSNTGSSIPTPTVVDVNNERRASDYFVEDADYLRLKTLRIGYQLPERWISKAKINVYAEVQNLWTVTNYTGLDPEVAFSGDANIMGIDRGIYPIQRTYLMGLNFKF